MVYCVSQWQFAIDRGPGCLFVRIRPTGNPEDAAPELADVVWTILAKHFTYRLVLEMQDVEQLASHMIGQLVRLRKKIEQHGGMLRLCGLSETCQASLDVAKLGSRLPSYHDRERAVLGEAKAAAPHELEPQLQCTSR